MVAAVAAFVGFAPAVAEAQQASNFCIRVYNLYKSKKGPKAFVTNTSGGCWWAAGQRNIAAAQQFALRSCAASRKGACRVVESAF